MPVELYPVRISPKSRCVFIVASSEGRVETITQALRQLGAKVGDMNFLELASSLDSAKIEAALGMLEENERVYFVEPANNVVTIGFEQKGRHEIRIGDR